MCPIIERTGKSEYGLFAVSAPSGSFESIATATGTGSSNTITFSSIPSTYQHLQLRWIARTTATITVGDIYWTINGSSSGYAYHYLTGNGTAVSAVGSSSRSDTAIVDSLTGASATSGIMGVGIIDFHDYASTTKNKTIRYMDGNDRNGAGRVTLMSTLWANTSAISSLTFTTSSGNFTTNTQFALYGIKGA